MPYIGRPLRSGGVDPQAGTLVVFMAPRNWSLIYVSSDSDHGSLAMHAQTPGRSAGKPLRFSGPNRDSQGTASMLPFALWAKGGVAD